MAGSALTTTVDELVAANRILVAHGIIDGFGHVSARDPENPGRFLISRSMAPALVRSRATMVSDVDGNAVAGDQRRPHQERFVHGEI